MSSHKSDTRSRILEAACRLLEQSSGKAVRMSDIAKAAGVSRQAVYLHFESRDDLMIATRKYVDEVKGLEERLEVLQSATTGTKLLEAIVDVWGNYIADIHAIDKAMMNTLETDEAKAAVWNDCMRGLNDTCREAINALKGEKHLAPGWSRKEAVEICLTTLSIHNWEQLTLEYGWSTPQYVSRMKTLLKRALIVDDG
ncbi:TetR/AcrR family transcriptional regulator [Magnetovibrio sp.]|uniref:TetR/AcrR family transcriptional regulator n=1 Tax=Magnetovibrio sp. TaxID=2024836 RepID=UPI002F92715A